MKNRNVLQKITIIALCIIIMITAMSGCSLKSLAAGDYLSYMKDKYGMDFTLVEDHDTYDLSTSVATIYVECSEYPGEEIFVIRESLNGGKEIAYHDNFVAIKYKQQTKELAEKMASNVLGECRVLYEPYDNGSQPDEFDNSTTFEEFISRNPSKIDIYILLPLEHTADEKDLKKLEAEWIKNHFVSYCCMYYITDEEAYRGIQVPGDVRNYDKCYSDKAQFDLDEDMTISVEYGING